MIRRYVQKEAQGKASSLKLIITSSSVKELSQLKTQDIMRKVSALDKNIEAFEQIQKHMELHSERPPSGEEEKELDKYRGTAFRHVGFTTGQGSLQHCQVHRTHYQGLGGCSQSYETHSEGEHYKYVKATHSIQSISRFPLPNNEELRTLLESIVLPVRKIIQRHDEEHAEVDSHSSGRVDSVPSAVTHKKSSSSLRLSLPTFSGDILDWKDFWRVFSSIINKESSLTDAEKICHLTAAMQSKESKELVQRAAGSTDDVMQELVKSYDKCKVVYLHHVCSILGKSTLLLPDK